MQDVPGHDAEPGPDDPGLPEGEGDQPDIQLNEFSRETRNPRGQAPADGDSPGQPHEERTTTLDGST